MTTILYEFPHSHFCEKARWAMDWKGLSYQRQSLLPPLHVFTTRRYGKRTHVPLLLDGAVAVQGSTEIINYLDDTYPEPPLTHGDRHAAVEREKRIDKELGVPLRVFFYHYGLRHKQFVCNAFLQNSGPLAGALFRTIYPGIAALIRKSYRIDEASATRARSELLKTLDRLWEEKQGRYLSGDLVGRLDITIASLLAPLPRPPEHPMRWEAPPEEPELLRFEQEAMAHPLLQWVKELYRHHRKAAL